MTSLAHPLRLAASFLAATACGLHAEVRMPATFADHMLLQQGKPIPVFGQAAPAEKVQVEFAGQRRDTVADEQGAWRVVLDPLPPSAVPAEMRIVGGNTLVIRDILVGDLWLASGQSNMEVRVREAENAQAEIQAADLPGIRFFLVDRELASSPRTEPAGKWQVCTPEQVSTFSAVAFFFARDLHTRHGIPIGIINSAVGSSHCESWVPEAVLRANPVLPQPLPLLPEEYTDWKTYGAVCQRNYEATAYRDPGIREECLAWAEPDFDDSGWKDVAVPGNIEARGMNIDGAVWFRCAAMVPEAWAGKDLSLNLGPITHNSVAFVNGTEVGRLNNNRREWVFRTHTVPGKLVRAGRNVVAVRIFNEIGPGGFHPSYPAPLKLSRGNDEPVLLPKTWKCQVELALEPAKLARQLPAGYRVPSALYNAMIAPYTATPVRGFLWYQGESNAGNPKQHDVLFPTMIQTWRQLWGDDTLPFYFVQLASYQKPQEKPSEEGWPYFRESQTRTLALPHTGMAVTIDIGDATNVHPKNKQDVGKRLALWARRDCYGETDLAVSGPLFAASTVEGNTIRIRFDQVYDGLEARGGELKGFAIAGADKNFVWAQARIDGDTVVVWSEAIPNPAHVRYAWATNPICTLYNKAGLPASSFRTDD